jgi:hypothetical protein
VVAIRSESVARTPNALNPQLVQSVVALLATSVPHQIARPAFRHSSAGRATKPA